ncbi:phosphomannomutase [Shewanella sp. 4t3-1-2LB]|uniref:phosphomannomutase n=1 Tax=Shewanella sp. 4t3-1-2LB TaxID=2817682 RepID=UPI001A995E60|nr:phosphomannomutase [Shewanella sp. 4t3-1-2LB]MBO1273478.1 phosphomannomutase [Shewanella sp. 4t3-1-2LB]
MLYSNHVISDSNIAFGTSGARGLVVDFTPDVCAAFTHAFIAVALRSFQFDKIAIAIDNRPSSYAMAQACAMAAKQSGIETVFYGVVPTPALAYQSMSEGIPAVMVTGSHIPFDRNGLKFYRPDGEITKADEKAILEADVSFESLSDLPTLVVSDEAKLAYLNRYKVFANPVIAGKRVGIYEHSSAGRDLYRELFSDLGAEVISLGRSEEFVPIDTEAVSEEDRVRARDWVAQYDLDLLFSTDGDGDRPLLAGEDGEWLRGDVLGILCAQALGIEALAVPVSCNTAIEQCGSFKEVQRTRIGSPYVIDAFTDLNSRFKNVAGFEANGGFLLGSDVTLNDKQIKALPTRDALLPVLAVLSLANNGIVPLVQQLPQRFTASDRIKNFATDKSKAMIAQAIKAPVEFMEKLGFSSVLVDSVNTVDGFRISLGNGDVIHLRPSGNAPELRCYAESDTTDSAQLLVSKTLTQLQVLD